MDIVAEYFNERAESWTEMEKNTKSPLQAAVAILAGVGEGARVLDLGSGLGIMMSAYKELGAARVLGVDISEKMVEIARARWADSPEIEFIVADGATLELDERFDSVVVYNAYPHFMDRPALARTCHDLLADGGRFVVAHSMGKDVINAHHHALAEGVSIGLGTAAEESALWQSGFEIDALVDTPGFYAFAGKRI